MRLGFALTAPLILQIKGFDKDSLTVCTLLFEGDADEVALHEAKIKEVAGRHGGFHAGEEAGKRGYLLTFVIAYVLSLATSGCTLARFEPGEPQKTERSDPSSPYSPSMSRSPRCDDHRRSPCV